MKRSVKFLSLLLFVMVLVSHAGTCQVKLYYDFEIDYFPQLKSVQDTCEEGAISYVYSGEFGEGLQRLMNRISSEQYIVKRFSGRVMKSSGIYPQELQKSAMWLRIVVAEDGTIESVNGYSESGDTTLNREALVDQLRCVLSFSTIYPGLVDKTAVNTVLFYTLNKEKRI